MRLRVLYIIGKGRSGSTLLGDVLGAQPNAFHLGEMWRLWSHAITGRHTCSCGRRAEDCSVWSAVLDGLSSGPEAWAVEHPQSVVHLQKRLFTFDGLAKTYLSGEYEDIARRFNNLMSEVYNVVSEVTQREVLIDSSKWPLDPFLASGKEDIGVAAVHLVRDPRAVSLSWGQRKMFPDSNTPMPKFGRLHSSLSWTARTMTGEWMVSRLGSTALTLRFEDFLDNPKSCVRDIGRLVDETWDLEVTDKVLNLPLSHSIMGNPSRFLTGSIRLRDPAWVSDPLVAMLTWPWRCRFGY